MLRTIALLVLISCFTTASATQFYNKKAQGWHWYQDKKTPSKQPEQTPTAQILNLRQQLETELHEALVNPTNSNMKSYMKTQAKLMDLSERFALSWQRVAFTNPKLDETVQHPVNQAARHIYLDTARAKIQNKIHAMSKEYGLLYFFSKHCKYCHEFAKTVKRFSDKYHWEVLAISIDGGSLPEFPNARPDNGIVKQLKITTVPALIAVHPKSKQLIPIAYGMVAENDMEYRIDLLTKETAK